MPENNRYGFSGLRLPSYSGGGAQTFPVLEPGSELLVDYASPNIFSDMNYGGPNALAYSVSGGQLTPNTSGLGLKVNGTPDQFGFGNGLGTGDSFAWGDFFNNHGKTLLGAAQGIGNLFMGMKQYGLAKDALKESRRQFELNYDAQRKLTNSRMMDRQNARRAADPTRHMSAEEYLEKYGV